MNLNDAMIVYAKSFLGIAYRWGGNNPVEGLDCSGFVCEVLRSVGIVSKDLTAQDIYNLLKQKQWRSQLAKCSILFFGSSTNKITHVAIALNQYQMIEAGGGNSKTLSDDIAERQNAFVRIRMISSRGDLVACIKPKLRSTNV